MTITAQEVAEIIAIIIFGAAMLAPLFNSNTDEG